MRAIYDSMTRDERKKPDMLDGGRRRRIARGAGVELNDVGHFIKQFEMTRDVFRSMGGGGMLGRLKLLKGLMSGDLASMGAQAGSILKTKKSGFMEKKDRNKKKKRR
jgi:signal recognition particle subunit SRP54